MGSRIGFWEFYMNTTIIGLPIVHTWIDHMHVASARQSCMWQYFLPHFDWKNVVGMELQIKSLYSARYGHRPALYCTKKFEGNSQLAS